MFQEGICKGQIRSNFPEFSWYLHQWGKHSWFWMLRVRKSSVSAIAVLRTALIDRPVKALDWEVGTCSDEKLWRFINPDVMVQSGMALIDHVAASNCLEMSKIGECCVVSSRRWNLGSFSLPTAVRQCSGNFSDYLFYMEHTDGRCLNSG